MLKGLARFEQASPSIACYNRSVDEESDPMIVTAWKGGTYGIRVGLPNVRKYFNGSWKTIEVQIDGQFHAVRLPRTFWSTCPEFRGMAVGKWLRKNRMTRWPYGNPPEFELIPLGGNKFKLKLH